MFRGKKRNIKRGGLARKPDFIVISNIYDNLLSLVENYGMTKVIQHLGCIANEKISREFAGKIWYIVSKPEERDGEQISE